MCALKFKTMGRQSNLNPFEKLTDKEKALIDLDFGYFWHKVILRRNMGVLPLLSIVDCDH